jgi:hypothetical protein
VKKLFVASILALGLLIGSAQQAHAQCARPYGFNASISLHIEGNGVIANLLTRLLVPPGVCPDYFYPCAPTLILLPGYGDYGAYYGQAVPAASAASSYAAAPQTGATQATYNTGYRAPSNAAPAYGYGYPAMQQGAAYSQVPSYWYGY